MVRKRINIKRPSLAQVVKTLGIPTKRWEGNCFGIASLMVEKKLVDGAAVYGHWLGDIHPKSYFKEKRGLYFCQHGWIVLKSQHGNALEGYICDPTRWVFEAEEPYIFWGKNDGSYDEGGNRFRMAMLGDPPKYEPDEDDGRPIYDITKHMLATSAWQWVEKLFNFDYSFDEQPVGKLTERQVSYLAHLPPDRLGEHGSAILNMLEKIDRVALMPIDNRKAIERMRGTG